jgi:type I restriction enzyme, S subunit
MIYLFWAYSHGLTEDGLRLNCDAFAEIPVAPPTLEQQRRIVAVADAWDQAIAALDPLTSNSNSKSS